MKTSARTNAPPNGETLISLDAASTLPELMLDGKKASERTLRRWSLIGLKLPSGKRVVLESVKIGQKIGTTREAVQRFLKATS